MPPNVTFDEVLDAVENLPPEQQADLLRLIQRRLAERGRQRVIEDVRDGRTEFGGGSVKPASVDDVMREFES